MTKLGDTLWFFFFTYDANGSPKNADSTPQVWVYAGGNHGSPILSPTPTNVGTGKYKVEIPATSGNGFQVGVCYNVVAQATVDGRTGSQQIGLFVLDGKRVVDLNDIAPGTAMTLTSAYDAAKTAASQASVDAIPTNPLLANDSRLDYLDASVSSRATQASVNAIPTNPLLDNDSRLSSLANLDATVSSRAKPGDAMTLTSDYDAAKTAASQASVNAIPTNPLLANDTRLDYLDASISSRATQASVNAIPTNPLLANDSRLNYLDAAVSTRASQASVDAIPTNPLLASDSRLNHLDASISSRASQTSVNAIPTNPVLTNDSRLNYLDASISSRASQDSVDAIPTNPLLANDSRLNHLDASIASVPAQTAASVWAYAQRTLTSFGSLVADIWAYVNRSLTTFGDLISGVWTHGSRTLTDKSNFQLAPDQAVNVTKVGGVTVTGPDDFKPDISHLATEASVQAVQQQLAAAHDLLAEEILTLVQRTAGLAGHNMVMDMVEVDGHGNVTAARIRLYDSPAHAQARGEAGKIAEFFLNGSWAARVLQHMVMTERTS